MKKIRSASTGRKTVIANESFGGISNWKVSLYLDGSFLTSYQRNTVDAARELAQSFLDTGICPRN